MGLAIDGLIIVVYFVAIVLIGLKMGQRENSMHDFALGGRNVPWWAVMASIIAAETSAATFLGAPGEGYSKQSLAYVQLVFGLIIGRFIVGNVFLEPYYRYKVYTVYDYLGVRFGPISKSYVSGLFLLMRTLASGARLFVPSLVMVLAWRLLSGQSGGTVKFSQSAVVGVEPYVIAIVALTIITCIYTALGGIKAVIWTDVIQAGLMFGGALIAMITLLVHVGGFGAVARAVPQMTHLEGYFITGFEPDFVAKWMTDNHLTHMTAWDYFKLILGSDYTVFSALIGTVLGNMAAFGTDQDMVQRMLTAETYKKARRSLLTAAFMDLPIAATFTFIGILLYVFYQQDPTFLPVDATGKAVNSDIFGSYILNVLPVGIRGLVLAGVFATAMGSLSAALNSLATSATNDWYLPRRPGLGEDHYVKVARFFTAIFSVLMILVAVGFAYAKVTSPDVRIIPVVLGIAGFILGPMLGVFLIGMFTRNRGSDEGNVLAVTLGLIATVVMGDLNITIGNALFGLFGHGDQFTRWTWLPKVSFTWFAMIGALVVFAVGVWFKTPESVLKAAEERAKEASGNDERPLSEREGSAA